MTEEKKPDNAQKTTKSDGEKEKKENCKLAKSGKKEGTRAWLCKLR